MRIKWNNTHESILSTVRHYIADDNNDDRHKAAKKKKKKNALEAKMSSQIRQRSQTTSVSPGLSRGLCHLCWESLLCLFLPELAFSSTILLFFVYPLITSNRGLEAQAQERRMVEENLERVLWLHIRTGVVPGKLPSRHDSLCSWKEGENQN